MLEGLWGHYVHFSVDLVESAGTDVGSYGPKVSEEVELGTVIAEVAESLKLFHVHCYWLLKVAGSSCV